MLKVRREQMDAFETSARRRFEDEMVEHMNAFAPRLCKAAGEAGTRSAIRLGWDRAHRYGFTGRAPITVYLELMFALGSDFDTDPQLYWSAETLTDSSLSDEMVRAQRLSEKSGLYLDEVAGPDNRYAIEALERLQRVDFKDAAKRRRITVDMVIRGMHAVYPQKAVFAGEPALRALVQSAAELAVSFALPADKGTALLAGLMFGLGHGICSDPLYPWIGNTLQDERIVDGHGKVERLLDKLQVYAQSASAHLSGS
jgi:hypothetical protein